MPRILLVEDDDNQRLLYREHFEGRGFEVIEARDGGQALRLLERVSPDAVVLDINMPGMDGLDALACIHERYRRLPVVLNSAYPAYGERFVSWIADAYVTKSSNLDELATAVRSVLTRSAPS